MRGAGVETLEVERKYEVPDDIPLPSQLEAIGLFVHERNEYELHASYFDTVDRALGRNRVAIRRRLGGHDAGWHLKAKTAAGTREVTWPADEAMPAGLQAEIDGVTGQHDTQVVAIAGLRTQRHSLVLADHTTTPVIELVDDRVHAHDGDAAVDRSWREWEAELLPGADVAWLDVLEQELFAQGAVLSVSDSKIARALGKNLALARERGARAEVLASLAVSELADRMAAEDDPQPETLSGLRAVARNLLAL